MKKFFALLLLLAMCLPLCAAGAEEDLVPYADSIFRYANAALNDSKCFTLSLQSHQPMGSIAITSCELQVFEGHWSFVAMLPPPPRVWQNTLMASWSADYSAYISTGVYRICYTLELDGTSIVRYTPGKLYE